MIAHMCRKAVKVGLVGWVVLVLSGCAGGGFTHTPVADGDPWGDLAGGFPQH